MHKNYFTTPIVKIIASLFSLLPVILSAQQSTCANSDFSEGTFRNWVGYTSCYPFDTPGSNIAHPGSNGVTPITSYYYKEGIVPGRHTIITESKPDPFTCGNVMTLPPNERFCTRLGNGGIGSWGDGVGWQRDILYYRFSITESNALLLYKFAAVFQDPPDQNNHTKELRPRFIITIKDEAGNLITPCGSFETFSDSTIPGYKKCQLAEAEKLGGAVKFDGDIIYSPWQTVGINLRKYIGQNIMIGFETWDCGLGGHFGYAYITAKCSDQQIHSNNCSPGKPVKLTAPEGFQYLWSTGEKTQSIILDSAKLGDSITVDLISKICRDTIKLKSKIFENFRVADFDLDSIACSGNPIHFTDKSEGENTSWKWDFGDGLTSDAKNPVHVFYTGGAYTVRLVVKNSDGCTDAITKSIYVCSSVGIQENTKQTFAIHAYPNPSTGTFKMQVTEVTTGGVQVLVTNILGQTIYAENNFVKDGVLQKELDITKQPDGIYFLTIKNNEYNSVLKLVKKN